MFLKKRHNFYDVCSNLSILTSLININLTSGKNLKEKKFILVGLRHTKTRAFQAQWAYHYCVSCTSKRYYWEKGWLLIMKNAGARDCSVRLFMSSNLFLETVVCYLFKLVGVVVFEYICGEWRRIDFNRIETFKISTILHLNDTRSTSSCPKMNWKLFMCQDHLVYIYGL